MQHESDNNQAKVRLVYLLLMLTTTLVFALLMLQKASLKPLWFDEILTAQLTSLQHFKDLWQALLEVCDTNPPLFYIFTSLVTKFIDQVEVAIRLPSIIGLILFVCFSFFSLKERCKSSVALAAAFLPLTSIAPKYFTEGRPYGLVLGLTALSFFLWQQSIARRKSKLIGMALTLTLMTAISLQYYAGLIFVPIAIGEAYRNLSAKKFEFRIFCCLALGATPLLLFLPLIENLNSLIPGYWSKVSMFSSTYSSFAYIYASSLLPVFVVGVFFILAAQRRGILFEESRIKWPMHEIVAGVCYLLLPVIGVLLSSFGTGIFTARYALPSVFGMGFLSAYLVSMVKQQKLTSAVAFVFIVAYVGYQQLANSHAKEMDSLTSTTQAEYTHPLVFADGLQFLQFSYYSNGTGVYVYNSEAARKHLGGDTNDRILLANSAWYPLNVVQHSDFFQNSNEFILVGSEGWLLLYLEKEPSTLITKIDSIGGRNTYRVTRNLELQ